MDAGGESWQETLCRCLAGTRVISGRAGSAPHLQPGKARLQIPPYPKDPSVPTTQVSQAPSTSSPARLAPGQPAWLVEERSFTCSPTQLRQEQGQETQSFELCSCLQTLLSAGCFLAWLCWRHCQSRSGTRPGAGMPWPGWSRQNKSCRCCQERPDPHPMPCGWQLSLWYLLPKPSTSVPIPNTPQLCLQDMQRTVI